MAKRHMDLETERAMKKELTTLVFRLLHEVEAGKSDEERAQFELAGFRKCYGFTELNFKPYLEASLQKVQMERVQSSTEGGESFSDDWPPIEPKNS